MNNILITGATGFIGSNLTQHLSLKGNAIHILVRKKELHWRLKNYQSKLHIYECDLLSPSLKEIINKIHPEYIFHCASYGTVDQDNNNNKIIDINIKGTLNLLEALKKTSFKLFVNTGSSSEYGTKNEPMTEQMMLDPNNVYGVSKTAATLLCQQVAKKEKLPIITLRLFSPYGYFEEKSRLIPSVILQSLENHEISLSSPTNVRDFIFIDDIISAYTACMTTPITPGEIFNIGSGQQHSVQEVVTTILQITKSASKPHWGKIPPQLRQQEPIIWKADIFKAKSLLQWKPQYSLHEGLKKTIAWFSTNKNLYA